MNPLVSVYVQLPDLSQVTVPCAGCVGTTEAGLIVEPAAVSFAVTLIVTGVLNGVVPASGVGVIWPGLIVVVAVLFAGFESGVSLSAVVTITTGVALLGVNMVVQVMLLPTAKVATGIVGVHVVVAPAGAPVTVQVAFAAAFGPPFVHVVVTVTGVPIVAGTVVGPVACMSAIAVGVCTQCGSFAGQLVGGVHGLCSQPVGGGGGAQVAPVQVVGSVMVFATNIVPSGIVFTAFTVTFTLAVPGVAPTCAGTLAKMIWHSVPAVSPPRQLLVAATVPLVVETKVVCAGTTSLTVYPATAVPPVFVAVRS